MGIGKQAHHDLIDSVNLEFDLISLLKQKKRPTTTQSDALLNDPDALSDWRKAMQALNGQSEAIH